MPRDQPSDSRSRSPMLEDRGGRYREDSSRSRRDDNRSSHRHERVDDRSHKSHRSRDDDTYSRSERYRDSERRSGRDYDEDERDRKRRKEDRSHRSHRDDRHSDKDSRRGSESRHDRESAGKERSSREYKDDISGRDSEERSHKRDSSKRRDRSDSEDDFIDIRKLGVKEITEDDYFLKSAEFKHWLKDSKGKYLDEMSGDGARKYFKKFVRRWNDGALSIEYYRTPPASSNTAYKWSFKGSSSSCGPSRPSPPQITRRRSRSASVESPPRRGQDHQPAQPTVESSDEEIGPSLPPSLLQASQSDRAVPLSSADRQLAKEEAQEAYRAAKKAERREAFERADEAAPRQLGREGKLAEKRASNAVNKEMRDKEFGGLEMDEKTLMGEESSFQAALRARESAQGRRAEKKAEEIASRRAAMDERIAERKQKEAATMNMLKAMARERFG